MTPHRALGNRLNPEHPAIVPRCPLRTGSEPMRASTAYFVGAGTIVAAIAIGLGGGIVAGNIMNPVASKQGPDNSKMAQRAEAAATPATTNVPSERVQYLTGSKAFGTVIAAPAQAEAKPVAKPDT